MGAKLKGPEADHGERGATGAPGSALRRLIVVDLNLLPVLHALLTERSVTRAAAIVGLTQSATSHALNRLRKLFKDPLLVRHGNEMVPTPLSVDMLPDIETALDALGALISRTTHFDPATSTAEFHLSTLGPEFGALEPVFARLRAEAPFARLVLHHDPDDALRLSSGDIDAAVVLGSNQTDGTTALRWSLSPWAAFVRRNGPYGRAISQRDWVHAEHIHVRGSSMGQQLVHDAAASAGLAPAFSTTVPDLLWAALAVHRSDAVLTAPAIVFEQTAELYELTGHAVPFPVDPVAVSVAFSDSIREGSPRAWFRRLIIDELGLTLPGNADHE